MYLHLSYHVVTRLMHHISSMRHKTKKKGMDVSICDSLNLQITHSFHSTMPTFRSRKSPPLDSTIPVMSKLDRHRHLLANRSVGWRTSASRMRKRQSEGNGSERTLKGRVEKHLIRRNSSLLETHKSKSSRRPSRWGAGGNWFFLTHKLARPSWRTSSR